MKRQFILSAIFAVNLIHIGCGARPQYIELIVKNADAVALENVTVNFKGKGANFGNIVQNTHSGYFDYPIPLNTTNVIITWQFRGRPNQTHTNSVAFPPVRIVRRTLADAPEVTLLFSNSGWTVIKGK